jgi:hypothetical protein
VAAKRMHQESRLDHTRSSLPGSRKKHSTSSAMHRITAVMKMSYNPDELTA